MPPYVVLKRLLPTYFFVAAVPMSPTEAQANVERSLSRVANLLTVPAFLVRHVSCLRATPTAFWHPVPSVVIRFVPSVVGTNLHVRLSLGAFWWTVMCGSAFSSMRTSDGVAVAAGAVVLTVIALLLSGIRSARQSVLSSLA
jgi:hypothetical protein